MNIKINDINATSIKIDDMNVANPVILKIGKTNPMLLQVCQPVRGVNKEKLIFINKNGEEQYVYDGSKEVKVPLSSGGGGIEEPIVLNGDNATIEWDASESSNAVVTTLDKKKLIISNAQAGQELTLQCYGNDIDFSDSEYNTAETLTYLFTESYQHWVYIIYFNGKSYDVTGIPVNGTTY